MSIRSHLLIASAGFPDPFAVATISGEQTKTTGVIKKTLNPYWNESFDMSVEKHHVFPLSSPRDSLLIAWQACDRGQHPGRSDL